MALAHVQSRTKTGAAGSVSIGSGDGWATPTSGNLLVLSVVADEYWTAPSGWSTAVSGANWSGNYIWYKVSAGTESTVSLSGGTAALVVTASEYSGTAASSVLDRTASNGFGTLVTSIASGTTATTTQADELLVANVGGSTWDLGSSTPPQSVSAWSNSFTERGDTWVNPDVGATASRIVSATGAYSTTATVTGGVSNGFGLIATFKAGSGATSLTVAPLDHAVTVDGVALAQAHTLTVASLAHSVTVDNVAVAVTHVLQPADLTHTVTVDNVTVTAGAATTGRWLWEVTNSPGSGVWGVYGGTNLLVHKTDADSVAWTSADFDGADLSVTDGTTVITATDVVVVADNANTVQLQGQGDFTRGGFTAAYTSGSTYVTVTFAAFLAADLTHTVTLDAVALTQAHTLTVAPLDLGVALDGPLTLTLAGQLEVAPLDLAVALDGPLTLTQAHTLTAAPLDVGVALDGPLTVTEHTAGSLVVQPLDLAVTLDQVALTQAHTLTVAPLDVGVALDGPLTITVQAVQLTVAGIDHTVTLDGVALSVTHVLVVQSLLLAVLLGSAESVSWSLWTGGVEVSCTLQGVYDGSVVQPVATVEVVS